MNEKFEKELENLFLATKKEFEITALHEMEWLKEAVKELIEKEYTPKGNTE